MHGNGCFARTAQRWLAAGLLLCGCDDAIDGAARSNTPPDTRLSALPPDLSATTSRVQFHWVGDDPDGLVAGFEWRLSDNGDDGQLDTADTLSSAWQWTVRGDSTFTVQADLDSFPPDLPSAPFDRHWRSYTFMVRAIDDDGARDPSPGIVSFTATTLTPEVQIESPQADPTSCLRFRRPPTFWCRITDPDADTGDVLQARHVLLDLPECASRDALEAANPLRDLPAERWSEWTAVSHGGVRVDFPDHTDNGPVVFAVQARDAAGAVTPTLRWGENLIHLDVLIDHRPLVTGVRGWDFGTFQSSSALLDLPIELLADGLLMEVGWDADASLYHGGSVQSRAAWDVFDPAAMDGPWLDPGSGWPPPGSHHRWGVRGTLHPGTNLLLVQARDQLGGITSIRFRFEAVVVPARDQQRPLLLVIDYPIHAGPSTGAMQSLQRERWNSLLRGVEEFDPQQDVVDVHADPSALTNDRLMQYSGVVWFVKGGDADCALHRRVTLPSQTLAARALELYQARVGNLLVCGPLAMLATVEHDPPDWRFPIVFDRAEAPPWGFGTAVQSHGTVNVGTTRLPYASWCVEAIEQTRPPPGRVAGEGPGSALQQRSTNCDALVRAIVDSEFLASYPSAMGRVVDLAPGPERTTGFSGALSTYQLEREEFYNANVTSRNVTLTPRSCQTTVFRWRARRDEGWGSESGAGCPPTGSTRSPLDGVPVALLNRSYSDSKPIPGAEDALWGFHPLAFDPTTVRPALEWLLRERWSLRTY